MDMRHETIDRERDLPGEHAVKLIERIMLDRIGLLDLRE
jgi:hypothetical protein